MSTKERQEFLTWYNQLKNEDFLFDFENEIEEYCRSDVDILRRCCLKFKELIGKNLRARPFQVLCNHCFRLQPSVPSTVPTKRDYWAHSASRISTRSKIFCHGPQVVVMGLPLDMQSHSTCPKWR